MHSRSLGEYLIPFCRTCSTLTRAHAALAVPKMVRVPSLVPICLARPNTTSFLRPDDGARVRAARPARAPLRTILMLANDTHTQWSPCPLSRRATPRRVGRPVELAAAGVQAKMTRHTPETRGNTPTSRNRCRTCNRHRNNSLTLGDSTPAPVGSRAVAVHVRTRVPQDLNILGCSDDSVGVGAYFGRLEGQSDSVARVKSLVPGGPAEQTVCVWLRVLCHV